VLGRQKAVRAFGPLDQRNGGSDRLLKADLDEFARVAQAIEIEVRDPSESRLVGLQNRKRRARHLGFRVAEGCSNEGARKRRLA
jgi:hypothetical protein